MEDSRGVILDVGSFEAKGGFVGDDAPHWVSRTVIGRPKYDFLLLNIQTGGICFGENALAKRGVLSLKNLVNYGQVADYFDYEHYVNDFYKQMGIPSEEHPVVLLEGVYPENNARERLTQIYFETMNVPSYYVVNSSVATLASSGLRTGTVVSMGADRCEIVPVFEGRVVPDSALFGNVGGEDLTDYFMKLLSCRGYQVCTSAERDMARSIKHQVGRAAISYGELSSEFPTTSVTLPTDEIWKLQDEVVKLVEPMFQPSYVGYSAYGLHDLIWQAHRRAPPEFTEALRQNILLCGGSSMFPGLQDRLTKQLKDLLPTQAQFKVLAQSDRKYASWIGASVMASLETFQKLYITKKEYDENGPSIVHTKCV